jgi:ubiquitin C-terminal hydrolase
MNHLIVKGDDVLTEDKGVRFTGQSRESFPLFALHPFKRSKYSLPFVSSETAKLKHNDDRLLEAQLPAGLCNTGNLCFFNATLQVSFISIIKNRIILSMLPEALKFNLASGRR